MFLAASSLNILLNFIVIKYFNNANCIYLITQNNDLIINKQTIVTRYKIEDNNVKLNLSVVPCSSFIVYTDLALEIFESIEFQISRELIHRFPNRKYLFLSYYDGLLFESRYFNNVLDFLLIDLSVENVYNAISYNQNKAVIIDKWIVDEHRFKFNAQLYPAKLHSGRMLNVGAFDYPPYVTLNEDKGVELMIIQEYCKRYNLSLNIVNFPIDKWGNVNSNFTGYGILGDLLDGLLDIGITGFYLTGSKLDFLDYVALTLRVGSTCIVPTPQRMSTLYVPFQPFDTYIWFLLLITFAIFVLFFWYILKRTYKFESNYLIRSLLTVVSIFMQQPTKLIVQLSIYRKTSSMMLLFTLIISSAYNSRLYQVLANPAYTHVINSFEDLYNSTINIGINHFTYECFLADSKYPGLSQRIILDTEQNLIKKMLENNMALLIEHFSNGYVIRGEITSTELKHFIAMKDDLFWSTAAIILQKSSIYQPTLYTHNLNVREAGLQLKWLREALDVTGRNIILELNNLNINSTPHQFKLDHVMGIFMIWIVGIITAVFCFLFEIKSKLV